METTAPDLGFLKDLDDEGFDWSNKLSNATRQPPGIPQGFNPQHSNIPQGSDNYRADSGTMQVRINPQQTMPPPAHDPLAGGAVLQCLTSELASLRQSVNELKNSSGNVSTQNNPSYDNRRAMLLQCALSQLANSRLILGQDPQSTQPTLFNDAQLFPPAPVQRTPFPFESVNYLGGVSELAPNPPAENEVVATSLNSANDDLQTKKLVRKQRNREAAQNSRMRKKLRMESLEENLASVMEEKRKYQIACEELTRRNQELENRLRASTCAVCGQSGIAPLDQDRTPVEATNQVKEQATEQVTEHEEVPPVELCGDNTLNGIILPEVGGDDIVHLSR